MANKRKKNSNPKRNAVLTILVTIVVAAVCLYTVLVGLGKDHLGSAKNIELGLDLAASCAELQHRVRGISGRLQQDHCGDSGCDRCQRYS